jgi:integrase
LRIVYCSKEAWSIVEAGAKEGPVFRNNKGVPWNKSAVNCAVRRLRDKTGVKGWCLNTTRHTWATNKLAAGVSPAIVAQLMGHADLSMISGVYGHLEQREESLREAVE